MLMRCLCGLCFPIGFYINTIIDFLVLYSYMPVSSLPEINIFLHTQTHKISETIFGILSLCNLKILCQACVEFNQGETQEQYNKAKALDSYKNSLKLFKVCFDSLL